MPSLLHEILQRSDIRRGAELGRVAVPVAAPVTDLAGVLSPAARQALRDRLIAFERCAPAWSASEGSGEAQLAEVPPHAH